MKANNAVAEKFQNWLALDVIPSIRKTGQYKATPTGKELLALAVLEAQKVIEEKNKEIAEMKPKAEFHDAVAASDDSISFDQMAKVLKSHGINDIGEIVYLQIYEFLVY